MLKIGQLYKATNSASATHRCNHHPLVDASVAKKRGFTDAITALAL